MSRFDVTRGQCKAWSILSRSHRAGRVASTYLFYGREGVGRWALAVEFAALLNCQRPVDETDGSGSRHPCGECRPCRSITALNFEGLHFVVPIPKHKNADEAIDLTNQFLQAKRQEPFASVEGSSPVNIPVSMARQVKKDLSLRAAEDIVRVVVFYKMEKMLPASADALLKMIEEPPPATVIILTAARPEALLPTIQSRAQRIRLERLPEEMIAEYIAQKHALSPKRARLLARIADGALGEAGRLAESDEGGDGDQRAVGLLLFKSLCSEPASAVVAQMIDLIDFSNRSEAEGMMRLWQSLIRDSAYFAATGDADDLVNVDFASEIRRVSLPFDSSQVATKMTGTIKNTLADFRLNVHIQAALVALVLKLKQDLTSAGERPAAEIS